MNCREITPLEAGFGMFVKLEKPNFIGKEALVKKTEGLKRKIVGFEMEGRAFQDMGMMFCLTAGYRLCNDRLQLPTLKKNIGLAMVDIEY